VRLKPTTLIPILIGMASIIGGCAGGGGGEVEMYGDEIAPFVDPATDAINELDKINLELARLDIGSLSRNEIRQKVEIAATATAKAHDKVTTAREGMHETIPPTKCIELHNIMFESLQVSEQGLGNLRLYYQLAFSGRDGSRALAEGNRLTAEADRIKSRGLRVSGECQ
jgi:hypothetical protein